MSTNEQRTYHPYGFLATNHPGKPMLGFNGEYLHAQTSLYILGSGYRVFSPSLYRFYSADTESPFRAGGLNAYAYCNGDPVNSIDPSGHSRLVVRLLKGLGNVFGRQRKQNNVTVLSYRLTHADRLKPGSPEPLAYASVNSRSSKSGMTHDYVSVGSYSSISIKAPPLPQRPPPSSRLSDDGSMNYALDWSMTPRTDGNIQDWINQSSSYVDQTLADFTRIPREGGGFSTKHAETIAAGIRRSKAYREATVKPRTPTLHNTGGMFTWRSAERHTRRARPDIH